MSSLKGQHIHWHSRFITLQIQPVQVNIYNNNPAFKSRLLLIHFDVNRATFYHSFFFFSLCTPQLKHYCSHCCNDIISTARLSNKCFNFSWTLPALLKKAKIYWCCEAVNLLLMAGLWGCYVFPWTKLATSGTLWFVDQVQLFGMLSSAELWPLKRLLVLFAILA